MNEFEQKILDAKIDLAVKLGLKYSRTNMSEKQIDYLIDRQVDALERKLRKNAGCSKN